MYCEASRFPDCHHLAGRSPALAPALIKARFLKKSGCHDHIRSLRTTCRASAASPRTIPRNAGAQINQAAGHAIIWSGTLSVRHDAQGARDGELSVPHRRGHVCAIDRTLMNELTATACARCSTCLGNPRFEQTSTASRRSLSLIPLFGGLVAGGALERSRGVGILETASSRPSVSSPIWLPHYRRRRSPRTARWTRRRYRSLGPK